MDYLNPTTKAVEDNEVLAAAKLIHWTTSVVDARNLQASHMVDTFKRLMTSSDAVLGLDGRSADVCLVICDIHHQGRATNATIQSALRSSKPLDALLGLGSIAYPDRIKTLRKQVNARAAQLGRLHWSRATGDFV